MQPKVGVPLVSGVNIQLTSFSQRERNKAQALFFQILSLLNMTTPTPTPIINSSNSSKSPYHKNLYYNDILIHSKYALAGIENNIVTVVVVVVVVDEAGTAIITTVDVEGEGEGTVGGVVGVVDPTINIAIKDKELKSIFHRQCSQIRGNTWNEEERSSSSTTTTWKVVVSLIKMGHWIVHGIE